ncbi:protein YnhH [Citrobacter rodentium]|uniref:protein YnhH n=1 Tax=Citrobacter rodentium TaxID=67825 RepID=UPI003B82CB1E
MRANCLLNGFSTLTCQTQRLQNIPSRWAETRAHIPLHALSMSPILRARHHNFRNTGFTSRRCAPEVGFPYPSQLKD